MILRQRNWYEFHYTRIKKKCSNDQTILQWSTLYKKMWDFPSVLCVHVTRKMFFFKDKWLICEMFDLNPLPSTNRMMIKQWIMYTLNKKIVGSTSRFHALEILAFLRIWSKDFLDVLKVALYTCYSIFVQICFQDSGCSVYVDFDDNWTNAWGGTVTRLKHEW